MEFVFIKGGCYQMGDTFGDGSSDEKPVHEVCVDDFYLGKYEVTQGQWREIMGNNPSSYKVATEKEVYLGTTDQVDEIKKYWRVNYDPPDADSERVPIHEMPLESAAALFKQIHDGTLDYGPQAKAHVDQMFSADPKRDEYGVAENFLDLMGRKDTTTRIPSLPVFLPKSDPWLQQWVLQKQRKENEDRYPVETVSWNDAQEFIGRFNQKTGKVYRLPTEAEWEYAARSGGKKYKYSWGNGGPSGNIADESAKRKHSDWTVWQGYDDGYAQTAPVGSFSPNELGLYDMTGNVWEWCSDWYGESYYGRSPRANPQGPDSGPVRVLRGGSWGSAPGALRASFRSRFGPSGRFGLFGFRLALPAQ
jgi:formylglycine-generating enzyme required for sulfatase activity